MSRDSELDQNLSGDFRKKFSSDLNEIRYVGRGRWVMHDGMPYGPIPRYPAKLQHAFNIEAQQLA